MDTTNRRSLLVTGCAIVALLGAASAASAVEPEGSATLRVMTFNVWHGLRSGESRKRFPGEDAERAERRFAWQIEEIRRLAPDVLLLQEVNPIQRRARRYAAELGFDEIHKVASCGLHLGKLYKIPRNVNEGLAILARPELGLRRVGSKRLSGNARCTDSWGFQTRESRYALVGEIELQGRPLLLFTTHLSAPPYLPPGFDEGTAGLVEEGKLLPREREEILDVVDRKRARNTAEAERLLALVEKTRRRRSADAAAPPVVLGGDLNTEPGSAAIRAIEAAGFSNAAVGPEFLTWDPAANRENQEIGRRRAPPLPTFDLPEIGRLLAPGDRTARQIDFVFVSPEIEVVGSRRAMDRNHEGLYPSDHFAVLVTLRLPDEDGRRASQ